MTLAERNSQRRIPQSEAVDRFMITNDCTLCGVCEYMCPQDAIQEAPNQFVVRRHLCNGCGECVPFCPVRAIVPAHEFKSRQQLTRTAQLRDILGRSE